MKMSRRAYAEMFGPTVGDRIRLVIQSSLLKLSKI